MTARQQPQHVLHLDLENEWVWFGEQQLKLPPKAFAVLRYLVERAERVVTKEELLRVAWPDTVVSEWALTTCIRAIRKALDDGGRTPQYIETVHRRGYRFIGTVSGQRSAVSGQQSAVSGAEETRDWRLASAPQAASLQSQASSFVGREAELAQLHQWLEQALQGERQIVFITGEAGIGKTTLVEAFLQSLASPVPRLASAYVQRPRPKGQGSVFTPIPNPQPPIPSLWIGRGQCIEHYGAGEAYLPVLEALGQLGRGPDCAHIAEVLTHYAPTWLVQLAGLVSPAELEALHRRVAGAGKERMLREMVEAIDLLTAITPLILWFEDLQWSDISTLDWFAALARRSTPARLLVLGTYRPIDVIVQEHPLKAIKEELHLHHRCRELPLELLSETHIAEYLVRRLGEATAQELPFPQLVRVLYQQTEGNPLFLVHVIDHAIAQGLLVQNNGQWELRGPLAAVEALIPENLQQMIERHFEGLAAEDRVLLEAAAVAGTEFSTAAVATAIERDAIEVEEQCEQMVRRGQFLGQRGSEEWPDKTVTTRYGFLHALYQQVLYERVPLGRCLNLHQRIGERIETGYGNQTRAVVTELAMHFERSRDYQRAVQYLRRAGENALRRSAYHEAIALFTRGLELLPNLPDTPERTQHELRLQMARSAPLIAIKGYAAPEVEQVYSRVQELCRQMQLTPQLFPVLGGLFSFYYNRAELQTALHIAQQMLDIAQRAQDSQLFIWAHHTRGIALAQQGDLVSARIHFEQGIALYDPNKRGTYGWVQDPGVSCLARLGLTLWLLGYADQASQRSQEALALARELAHPFTLAYALLCAGIVANQRKDWHAAQQITEELLALSQEYGFPYHSAGGALLRGHQLVAQGRLQEGVARIRHGLTVYHETGVTLWRPTHLTVLAQAYGEIGRAEAGLAAVAEALAVVNQTEERCDEAELYRLKGELVLQSAVHSPQSKQVSGQSQASQDLSKVSSTQHLAPSTQAEAEAEACFLHAVEIARHQQAKSLELRAAMSLSRLWQQQGKKEEARQMLAEIYGWFTEGFDTADLRETRVLLEELTP